MDPVIYDIAGTVHVFPTQAMVFPIQAMIEKQASIIQAICVTGNSWAEMRDFLWAPTGIVGNPLICLWQLREVTLTF